MYIIVKRYPNGETLQLTTESPASSYGLGALRYTGCTCSDMGPGDQLCIHAYPDHVRDLFGPRTAADEVNLAGGKLPSIETTEEYRPDTQQWIYLEHDPAADKRAFLRGFCAQLG